MSKFDSNSRTDSIVQVEDFIKYAGPYWDDYDNSWKVSISGQAEDVMSIMGRRRFVLNAIPEGDSPAFQAQMEQIYLLQRQEERTNNEEGNLLLMPGLEVEIELENIVRKGQKHAIQIQFDPEIRSKPHRWRIILNSPVAQFYFSFTEVQGSVSSSAPSASSGGSRWETVVTRVSGNPAEYDCNCAAVRVS